jgi:uncharacterized membrane protein
VGLVLLWPTGQSKVKVGPGLAAKSERAKVVGIEDFSCSGFQTDTCRRVEIELESGADRGKRYKLQLGSGGLNPQLDVGNAVRVTHNVVPPGAPAGSVPEYSLSDFERRAPMLWLAIAFALLVVLFGRVRGALSLAGLLVSLAVVLVFIVPAILEGESPLAVALVGSFAIMLAAIPLAHGLGPKSLAAVLGTGGSLLLTAGLAVLFTDLTHLTGLSSEEATLLQINDANLSLEGLLLAGMVIGALGVLDDVTITQASTVLALRGADPSASFRALYSRAIAVGRDHVSATVNTLVLAYVGAALPVLLIFSSSELGFFDAVNVEQVAKEIVAMLVGSIGLIAAVPLTTALAAVLSTAVPEDELREVELGHVH